MAGESDFGGDFGGPAGPGPSEGAESDSDYGVGLGLSDNGSATFGSALDSISLQSMFDDAFDPSQFNLAETLSMPDLGISPMNLLDSLPKGLKGLMAALDKSGVLGQALGKAGMMANPDQGKAWGGALGGMLGGMFGGPLGGALGAWGGGQLGQGAFSGLSAPGNAAESEATSMNAPGGWQDMLQGLGGIYAGYKGSKESGDMLSGLQGLYSQNSPYAQQLRQQLQRQDAAGGRRSQYGPREVELQARLAQMASGQIPAMAQLQRQQQLARNGMLQQGIGLFDKMGGLQGLQQLFQGAGGGNMFGGGIPMPSGSDTNWFGGGMDQGFDPNQVDWGF